MRTASDPGLQEEAGVAPGSGPRRTTGTPEVSAGEAGELPAGRDGQQLVAHRGRGAPPQGRVEVATRPRSLPTLAPAGRHAAHGWCSFFGRSLLDGILSKAGAIPNVP